MKIPFILITFAVFALAADSPRQTPATSEERIAILQQKVAMQDAELTFQQQEISSLKAQIADYERALMQPTMKAQSDINKTLDAARKAHNATGCGLLDDGSWKCPEPKPAK